jgi:uncharacterized iron-regulated membrane protein
MWSVTGLYFAFPSQARAVIGALSPITSTRAPTSQPADTGATPPDWRAMLDHARRVHPDGHVARVVLPFGDRGAFLVMFASASPTPIGEALDAVYLDRFTGARLQATAAPATLGDAIVRSMAPLHIGSFGGGVVRAAWFIGGLMPAFLFVTGFAVWWNRVRRRRAS